MYSLSDTQFYNELKDTHPEVYDKISSFLSSEFEDLKLGCHTIQNILTLIYGNVQLLEHTFPELKENPRWNFIRSDISVLSDYMIAISAYRYAHVITRTEVNVGEYIRTILKSFSEDEKLHTLKISYNIPDDCPNVSLDIDKLQSSIKAILENITDIGTDDSAHIDITYTSDKLIFKIYDNLNVNNSETLTKIFRPFNTNKPDHIGLGLATAYRIAVAHGGELTYQPNTPCGSIFTLSIQR